MTARIIGRYEVLGLLGSGGIGQVYVARDETLGRSVAIKVLRPEYSSDRSFLERFHAEATSLARLSHPNIATLYDLQADGQQFYMIMELVRGHTLEAVLARTRPLDVRSSLAIIAQTVAGLGYAHQMGVIHRDIKPSNLMLTDSGMLKIMDFGIARIRGSQRLTRTGSIVGTLAYVAPEQIKGSEGDERSDLYSLACVLYEMLSGDPPFNAKTEYELIRAQVDRQPEPLTPRIPDLPAPLDRALMRALAKIPEERFASIEEFGRALGTEAISSQSADILRNEVLATMGPPPTPAKAVGPIPAPASVGGNRRREAEPSGPQSSRGISGAADRGTPDSKSRLAPVVTLGSVAAVLLLGIAYISLSSGLSPSPSPAPDRDTHAVSPPARDKMAEAPNQQTPAPPQSNLILPPPGAQKSGQSVETPGGRSPSLAGGTTPPRATLEESAGPPRTDESPAYKGRVADWPGPNLIAVPLGGSFGFKFLKLFGILDVGSSEAKASEDHRKMQEFLAAAGGEVTCYARGDEAFQCYANKQDIALWAVKNGFARPTASAPKEYREARK